jgi:hypothetical protein
MAWLGVFHELHCIVRVISPQYLVFAYELENDPSMGVSRLLSPQLD